jgi:hypothetical protein
MKIISHRRNTLEELAATPRKYGVEVDIRSYGQMLVVHHDPFVEGVLFEKWLSAYSHDLLILNVKEEGLETQLIKVMESFQIVNFFFLDQSFPFLIKHSKQGERRCAVRVSEFESIRTALTLAGMVDWVWVDCFSNFPLSHDDANLLKEAGFKICIVSPELQGRDANLEIVRLAELLKERSISVDAVCTKRPDIWERLQGL